MSRETRGLLAFVIIQYVAAAAIAVLVCGDPWRESGILPPAWFLTGRQGGDSWASMAVGYEYVAGDEPRAPMYQEVFFSPHLKGKGFQYPPTALFVTEAAEWLGDRLRVQQAVTWLWIPITALLLALLDRRLVPAAGLGERLARDALCIVATLTFFPVMRAYADGQMQTWINGLLAAALLAIVAGRDAVAGVAVGIACVLKPQSAFLAVWAAWRGRRAFVGAFTATVALFAVASIARYGLESHLEYVDVLRFLSLHGESFYPNQSVNGLLHRWFANGYNLTFFPPTGVSWIDHFPPYHAVVYVGTAITSILLLSVALIPPRRREERGGGLDFALALMAATAASPIAWEHHYGVLLPIFLLVYRSARQIELANGFFVSLAVCYVLAANPWWITRGLAATVWNPLQSYLLFATLALMALAWTARDRGLVLRK